VLRPRTNRRPRIRNRKAKKARLGSRADKGLEIFFVNEKVCFGKQRFQYSGLDDIDYSHNQQSSVAIATTIIFYDLLRCFLHRLL
jgi:hypothetical protein